MRIVPQFIILTGKFYLTTRINVTLYKAYNFATPLILMQWPPIAAEVQIVSRYYQTLLSAEYGSRYSPLTLLFSI